MSTIEEEFQKLKDLGSLLLQNIEDLERAVGREPWRDIVTNHEAFYAIMNTNGVLSGSPCNPIYSINGVARYNAEEFAKSLGITREELDRLVNEYRASAKESE